MDGHRRLRSESQAREDPSPRCPTGGRSTSSSSGRSRRAPRPTPLSLLIVDVDRFKDVNDLFGHPAGDAALRRVAESLRAATRDADAIARLGGDEFAVLMADCEPPTRSAWRAPCARR